MPTPADVANAIREIADKIDRSTNPSLSRVSAALVGVLRSLTATHKSLALAIRDALFAKITDLVKGEFSDFYDTSSAGKGWRPGYVSFGLQPASWQNEGIIGGILVQCKYDAGEFRSEKKDDSGADFKHSKGGAALTVSMTGAYYNKKPDGSVEVQGTTADLGTAVIALNEREEVEEVELQGSALASGISHLIREIQTNPPDYAQSARRKQKHTTPTGSPRSFVNWLMKNNRSDVGKSEVEALVRAMAERGTASGTAREQVMDLLRKARIPVNPNA